LSSEPSDPSTVSKRFTALAKSLGFDGLTFHALRHTHASILIGQNVPITSVSKRLGHANSQITLSVYAHALKGAEDQAFAAASSITSSVLSQN
jgi:integrase